MFKNFQLSFLPTCKACRDFTFVGVHASYKHGRGEKGPCNAPWCLLENFLPVPAFSCPSQSRKQESWGGGGALLKFHLAGGQALWVKADGWYLKDREAQGKERNAWSCTGLSSRPSPAIAHGQNFLSSTAYLLLYVLKKNLRAFWQLLLKGSSFLQTWDIWVVLLTTWAADEIMMICSCVFS